MYYENLESLKGAVNVVNETDNAIRNRKATIEDSNFSNIVLDLKSNNDVNKALNSLLEIKVPGRFVLTSANLFLAGAREELANNIQNDHLKSEKTRLYKAAFEQNGKLVKEIKNVEGLNKEREEYLKLLSLLLTEVINKLKEDIE